MLADNLSRIKTIAKGLGELNERVVYVGGAVAQLSFTSFLMFNLMTQKDRIPVSAIGTVPIADYPPML